MSNLLFPKSLISIHLKDWIPTDKQVQISNFVLRPLDTSDFERNFVETLSDLTVVKPLPKSLFLSVFENLKRKQDYYIIVIHDTINDVIAASGTIVVEQKFIHSGGKVGHIEGK
jgi:glucosamine-phosphate N-acetyltransferase